MLIETFILRWQFVCLCESTCHATDNLNLQEECWTPFSFLCTLLHRVLAQSMRTIATLLFGVFGSVVLYVEASLSFSNAWKIAVPYYIIREYRDFRGWEGEGKEFKDAANRIAPKTSFYSVMNYRPNRNDRMRDEGDVLLVTQGRQHDAKQWIKLPRKMNNRSFNFGVIEVA